MASFQYPPGKPASTFVLSPQAESFLTNVARQTAIKMAAYQQEWHVEKMKTKLLEYIHKAAKAIADGGRNWEKMIEDFASRFVEGFWAALGDKDWLDKIDVNDLAYCVQTSIIGYFPNSELSAVVNNPEYGKACVDYTEIAFDACRYSNWGWQVFKECLANKIAQKKVGAACDAAREKLVKTKPETAEEFVKGWIKLSIDELGTGIHSVMTEIEAIKLFNKLTQKGCGIPVGLLKKNGGKPPKNSSEISDIVEEAYKAYPQPKKTYQPASASSKGDGKDAGGSDAGGKGWGNDSWGGDSWGGWDDMMTNMWNMMMAKGGFDGGKGGCGGCGDSFQAKGGCGGCGGCSSCGDGFQGKGGCGSFGDGFQGKGGCGSFGDGFQGKGGCGSCGGFGDGFQGKGGCGGCGGFGDSFQGKGGGGCSGFGDAFQGKGGCGSCGGFGDGFQGKGGGGCSGFGDSFQGKGGCGGCGGFGDGFQGKGGGSCSGFGKGGYSPY